jgi:transposase
MRPYPLKQRNQVLRKLDRGHSPTEIARELGVSRVWVYKVKKRFLEKQERGALRVGGYRRSRLAGMESKLRGWITTVPTLTLAQMQDLLGKAGLSVTIGALWHQLNKWGLTYSVNARRRAERARGRSKQMNSDRKRVS